LRLLRTVNNRGGRTSRRQHSGWSFVSSNKPREPFDIIGAIRYYRALPDQVSHARLMSIMRFSAIATALLVAGTRAPSASG